MTVEVARVDGLVTCQDRGRFGVAHLGVPRAGALDGPAADLANRLVGNHLDDAVLECTGGVEVVARRALTLAVTGARCPVAVDGRQRPWGEPVSVARGSRIVLGAAVEGVRAYLAVGGGFVVPPVLGSRSTDTLAWVGPPRVEAGQHLPLGEPPATPASGSTPRVVRRAPVLRVVPGPRLDWMTSDALEVLTAAPYVVQPASNRIGLRLDGPRLRRALPDELPSEGVVLGGVQVPPDGRPVVFLHDHPVTGGYPVVAVVLAEDLPVCAQLRPGDEVTFRLAPRVATV